MKLYRDNSNNIYAYEEDGSQDYLIGDKIPITEQQADVIRCEQMDAAFDQLDYSEKRRMHYPSIGDQLDALYRAGVFPDDMAERIRAIKQQYPKT